MNIFSFLTALVICVTLVAIAWRITTKAISIRIIRTTEAPKFVPVDAPKVSAEEIHKTPVVVGEELTNVTAAQSMDAVIKACNELMGVTSTEESGAHE